MNKLVITTILALASAASSFAQGTISFGNQVGTTFISPVYNFNPAAPTVQQTGNSATLAKPAGTTAYGGALLSGSGYSLGLFYATSAATPLTGYTLAGFQPFRTAANAAALPNGLISSTSYTLAGHEAGTTVSYFVAAWNNSGIVQPVGGATWGAVGTALGLADYGISGVATSGGLGGTDSQGNLFLPPATTGFTSFSLVQNIPEPASFALAGLGAAAMMIFRRRK